MLSEDKAGERMLTDRARAWIESEERAPGYHASDFLDPLQKYWQEIDPKPLPDRLITMFLVGKILHAFVIGSVSGSVDLSSSDSGSSVAADLGITYSPDHILEGKVQEFKTTRSYYEPKSIEDVALYLEQLLVYMVATNTLVSGLWILFLNLKDAAGKTAPAFRCYKFEVSQADLDATREIIRETKANIARAIETRNPRLLPLCRVFKCGAANCEWYGQCKPPGRYGDPTWDGTAPKKRGKKQ